MDDNSEKKGADSAEPVSGSGETAASQADSSASSGAPDSTSDSASAPLPAASSESSSESSGAIPSTEANSSTAENSAADKWLQERGVNAAAAVSSTVTVAEYPGPPSGPPTIRHADGRVDLRDESSISGSNLYNHDLAPVPVAKRTWTTYNYAALWTSMSACIPTYMLASGFIVSGMTWWQALLTILLGNIIVLIPILLNSHPGTKYGIPFPVFARAAYGTYGSNLPALMRALVACGWFGIQCWIGGQAIFRLIVAFFPAAVSGTPISGHFLVEWFSFGLFWALNVLVIIKGMELVKKVSAYAAPFVLIMCLLLVLWAVSSAHGVGALISQPSKYTDSGAFLSNLFIPSLTAVIGFWATLSLNMPDFTRFGHSQREQTIGQAVALPTAMTVLSAMGVIVTSAALIIYPGRQINQLWDPIALIGLFDNKLVVLVALLTVAIATLAMNISANVVSPANDFSNALPRWISFRTGGIMTAVIGIFFQPWKLLADPHGYIFKWLIAYSGGLGSIAGVLVVDYWIIKRKQLQLQDLYLPQGEYKYIAGWNWAAVLATLLGCAIAWGGHWIVELEPLLGYGWFVGFVVSAVSYMLFMPAPAKQKHGIH